MSFLTGRASVVRSAALRPAFFTSPRSNLQIRFATQGYGSGKGNPAGEKPEKQGQNLSEHIEHPGPAPPKVAQGKSSSSPNQDSQSSSSQSTGSQSQSNDGAAQEGSGGQSVKGAQPKILNEKPPSKDEQSEDVVQHNREMENRAEKAHEQISDEDAKNDKVSKDFWKGRYYTSSMMIVILTS